MANLILYITMILLVVMDIMSLYTYSELYFCTLAICQVDSNYVYSLLATV